MSAAEQDAGPDVSVVIASRRRETRLAFALDALADQTLGRDRFDVIVVRDGPLDGPATTAPEGLPVRFIDLPRRVGPSVARDRGWRAAHAPLIAFTDDDCRPAPDWLERMLAAWEREGRDGGVVIQGRTEPDPDERHLLRRLARSQRIDEPSPSFQCCNIAYPRELLERLEGFDEEFSFGGEDTDLGMRALESDARLIYAGDVLVWHAVHARGLVQAMRDGLSWETMPLLIRRHPRLREAMVHRYFWKEAHEAFLLAALGVAAAPRTRGLSLVAAAPYVRQNWARELEPTPRQIAGFAAFLAERAAVDAAEVFATARAAIRYRTPLL